MSRIGDRETGFSRQRMQAVPRARSELMSRVRGKNTAPEMRVRRLAHLLGYRFRLHRRDLPGSPDIVFVSRRKVVFVHGCFWHRHPGCKGTTSPKTRADYWQAKFCDNMVRDQRVQKHLRELGWDVLVIWECETEDQAKLHDILFRFLSWPPIVTPPPGVPARSRRSAHSCPT